MTTHIMLDIETLGTAPGSVILSIGATRFDREGPALLGGFFYAVIDLATCRAAGLTEDAATLEWWSKQVDGAQYILDAARDPMNAIPIGSALSNFAGWVARTAEGDEVAIWGNGAAFDNALVAEAARRCGLRPLWSHRSDRCFRTLKALDAGKTPAPAFIGVPHDALDDARHQARHAAAILNGRALW